MKCGQQFRWSTSFIFLAQEFLFRSKMHYCNLRYCSTGPMSIVVGRHLLIVVQGTRSGRPPPFTRRRVPYPSAFLGAGTHPLNELMLQKLQGNDWKFGFGTSNYQFYEQHPLIWCQCSEYILFFIMTWA